MKKYTTLIFSLSLFCITKLAAQDFHLSQYDAAPLNLNPAMTGMFDGYYRIHGHYRTQWSAVATKPYVTTGLSFDMPVKKFFAGIQVMNYRAGAGNYNIFSLLFSGGYDFAIDQQKLHHISGGLQIGAIQTSLNLSKLTFESQYDAANGGGFNTGLPTGEQAASASSIIHDLNAGLVYYYANTQSRINPFIGFSVFHLTQPNQAIFAGSSKLPIRLNIHGGCKVNISETIQILPKFLYMDQLNNKELTMSIIGHYYLKPFEAYLFFGPTFRNKDAAILEGGVQYGKYTYRLSYDVNTSALIDNTNGRGGLEFSVTYIPKAKTPNPIPTCPRL